jgi:hypothetical protein
VDPLELQRILPARHVAQGDVIFDRCGHSTASVQSETS